MKFFSLRIGTHGPMKHCAFHPLKLEMALCRVDASIFLIVHYLYIYIYFFLGLLLLEIMFCVYIYEYACRIHSQDKYVRPGSVGKQKPVHVVLLLKILIKGVRVYTSLAHSGQRRLSKC